MSKGVKTIRKRLDTEKGIVEFAVEGFPALTVYVSRMSDENRAYATLHGVAQKVGDAAALERDPVTGRSASAKEKWEAMKEIADHLNSGSKDWNPGGRAARGSGPDALLLRALVVLYPAKSEEALRAFLDAKSPAERKALLASRKVQDIVATFHEVKAVDTDSLLSELE
jgi:hypothetical protein